jgi:ribosome-associated protein
LELDSSQKADAIVKAARDRRALNIVLMDMRPVTTICDYFVICHGRSPQHLEAIVEEIKEQMKQLDITPAHVEGSRRSRWMVMDYLHVVVHIFSEDARRIYDLERLWSDARIVAEYSDA